MSIPKSVFAAALILTAFGAHAEGRDSNRNVRGSFESNSQHSARKHTDKDINARPGQPNLYAVENFDDTESFVPAVVSAIPEPETVVMMLIGVGLIGTIVRRRTKS
jgi:hypothetical protein